MAKHKRPAGGTARLVVHENLRAWRIAQGKTQTEIATLVGRSQDWLSRAERGQVTVASEELFAWADALNLNIWQAAYQAPPATPTTVRAAG